MTQVLSVASESIPLVKTGGLADVAGALPGALAGEGIEVAHARAGLSGRAGSAASARDGARVRRPLRRPGAAARGAGGGPRPLRARRAASLSRRPATPMPGRDGRDWPDNAQRFAALGRAAARDRARASLPAIAPDIVHAHDWQAGSRRPTCTYGGAPPPRDGDDGAQPRLPGRVPAELLATLGLPPASFAIDGVEYYGGIGFLKAGLQFADRITTVSPTYAARDPHARAAAWASTACCAPAPTSVRHPERHRRGGVGPGAPIRISAAPFSRTRVDGRAANKAALQERFGLHDAEAPAVRGGEPADRAEGPGSAARGVAVAARRGRATRAPGLRRAGARSRVCAAAAARIRGRVGVVIGYDEPLAHLIQGGSDALLVPSRFEPCGLTQLCALRYGAVADRRARGRARGYGHRRQ